VSVYHHSSDTDFIPFFAFVGKRRKRIAIPLDSLIKEGMKMMMAFAQILTKNESRDSGRLQRGRKQK